MQKEEILAMGPLREFVLDGLAPGDILNSNPSNLKYLIFC